MVDSAIEEIKSRLDIVEVIGGYLKLKKAGANFQALCPFHSEKKPSFFVSPTRQLWKCFGCGKAGSIFDFIMEIEGMEFGDALKILAQKAGVELKSIKPEIRTERQRLYEICELSCRFLEKQLRESKMGKEVKKYLLGRGIKEESQLSWRLGYSPSPSAGGWRALSDFLVNAGYKREEIEKAGLAIRDEKGHFYDRFRARIMFPIFDLHSRVIGFGARVFEHHAQPNQAIAKYLNTPSTLLYDKSRVLYGLDRAKVAIRKKDACILTEGYTDVILSHQAGIDNVVATSGASALTLGQLRILKRYSEKLITAFDMDVAGDFATKRGIDLAQESGFDVKVALLPKENDPADVISQDPKEWEEIIRNAKSILDFYFETTLARFDKNVPEGKAEISKILLPVIKRISNKIIQSHWIQKLAKELGVKEEDVLEEVKKTKLEMKKALETSPELSKKSRKELLEERLLVLILRDSQNLDLLLSEDINFLSPGTAKFCFLLKGQAQDFEALKQELTAEEFELLNLIKLEAEIKQEEEDSQKEFQECLSQIKSLFAKEKLKEISREIKLAEELGDLQKTFILMKEFDQLTKKLKE